MNPYWQAPDGAVTLHLGDCLDVLAGLPDASIDAVVTDPPYNLGFMGREFDTIGTAMAFQGWCQRWASECLRVLKPGGYLLAFGGTRTWHRLSCGIEDAGFDIRDSVADLTGREGPGLIWAYGSGFPKSHDVSKAIDKMAGAAREVTAEGARFGRGSHSNRTRVEQGYRPTELRPDGGAVAITAPATDDAARWAGWGTALKPAWEPIVVGRKPLAGNVAANVLQHGTGALNIDACRVVNGSPVESARGSRRTGGIMGASAPLGGWESAQAGRWPPNVLLGHGEGCRELGTREVQSNGHHPSARGAGGVSTSGHAGQNGLNERRPGTETVAEWECCPDCPVAEMDQQSGAAGASAPVRGSEPSAVARDAYGARARVPGAFHADAGGASRFFPVFRYEAKAASSERPRGADGTAHPTVKPVNLISWLVKLVTRPGGTVLDPFAGSGTTAEACLVVGFRCVLIEKDPAYAELIRTRLRKDIQPVMFGGVA